MNINSLLLIVRARIKIVLYTFAITVLTALLVSLLMPQYYKAATQVVVNYTGTDSVTGSTNVSQMSSGYLATQVDIIKNRSVALKVVDSMKLVDDDDFKEQFSDATKGHGDIRQWVASQLIKRLEVSPLRESSVLELSFSGKDPKFVTDVANAFADAYLEQTLQLKMEPAQKAAGYFNQQVTALRDNLAQAQSRLSQYQQDKGITSVDERLDVESTRLNELSQQLVIAQSAAIEAQSRQQNAQKNASNSPDVALNPVIQNLRVEAARAAAKLADLSERLGPSHPEYIAADAELKNIQSQLYTEIGRTSSSIKGSAMIQQQRMEDVREQVAQQKQTVLKLNRMRDEMTVLQKDVDTAQKALDAVTQRFSQTSIEAHSNQNDIAILAAAQLPSSPYSPRIALNIALSILIGGVLGIGLAIFTEMMDRRVRSSDDIVELLKVPVISLANKNPTTGLRLLPGQSGKFFPSA